MKKFSSILIILAGILWGTMGVFVEKMQNVGFSSLQTASLRVTVAAAVMIVMLFATDKSKLKIRLRDIYLFIIMGTVCIFGMSLLYFCTIVSTSLSVAAILLYTAPIWVIIISAIFFHEKITLQKLLALALAFLGCIFVSGVGGAKEIGIISAVTGLGSGITYGLYSIFGSIALKKYHPYTVSAYSFLFAAASSWMVSNPPLIVKTVAEAQSPAVLVLIIATGIVTAFMPFMLYTCGLKNTEPGRAAIMASVEPLVATLIGFFVYKQSVSVIGIVLIALAILLVNNFGKTNKTDM